MSDTKEDTLQGESQTQPDVSEDTNTQPETVQDIQEDKPPKGYVPYADLKKERERRKAAEAKLQETPSEPVEYQQPIQDDDIRNEIKEMRIERLLNKHPEVEAERAEFEDFVDEHPEYSLEDAVDLFRVRKGLIGKPRKGLEAPTAGPKTPPKPGFTAQEVEEMRKNEPRKYQKLLLEGKFDKIKF